MNAETDGMKAGDEQTFRNLHEFEAQEGKITRIVRLPTYIWIFTAIGTYRIERKRALH